MSAYTPTTGHVRAEWAIANPPAHRIANVPERAQEFDRWLAEHDDEVRVRTLEVAAVIAESVDVWDEERTRSSDHDLIAAKLRELAESQKVAAA